MDCQTCNDLLLDLAYGELDEVRAAAVRRHAEGCADCTQALRRIERGRALARQLALEEAPGITDAVRTALAAATAQPLAVAGAAVPPSTAAVAHEANVLPLRPARGVTRWLDRVGDLAMRRQVAMAAVFVVMLGVGLVFYQTHPRPSETQDDRVPDVVPAVEVSSNPAQAAAPQAPAARMRAAEREDSQRTFRQAGPAPSVMPSQPSRVARAHGPARTPGTTVAAPHEWAVATDDPLRGADIEQQSARAEVQPSVARSNAPAAAGMAGSSGAGAGLGAAAGASISAPSASAPPAGWQAEFQSAQSAAHRGDGSAAVSAARAAMAQAPSASTRAGIAARMAPILRAIGRSQEADELLAQASVATASASHASAISTPNVHHAARHAMAPATMDSVSPAAPAEPAQRAAPVDSTASGL